MRKERHLRVLMSICFLGYLFIIASYIMAAVFLKGRLKLSTAYEAVCWFFILTGWVLPLGLYAGREWARKIAMIISVILLVMAVMTITTSMVATYPTANIMKVPLGVIGNAVIVVILIGLGIGGLYLGLSGAASSE